MRSRSRDCFEVVAFGFWRAAALGGAFFFAGVFFAGAFFFAAIRISSYLVVTEYGIADLKSASLVERAQALIQIAHPDFRDELANA